MPPFPAIAIAFLSCTMALGLLCFAVLELRSQGLGNGLVRSFALNALTVAVWNAAYCAIYLARDVETVRQAYALGAVGWALIPFATAHLGSWLWLSWTERPLPWPLGLGLLAAGLAFAAAGLSGQLLAADFSPTPWGWRETIDLRFPLDLPWLVLAAAAPLYAVAMMLATGWRKASNKKRLQARIFIIAGCLAFACSLSLNLILPELLGLELPVLGHLVTGAWFVAIGFALRHYRSVLSLSPEFAAESVIMNMSDLLFLVDPGGIVVRSNPAAWPTLACDPDALVGRPVDEFLVGMDYRSIRERIASTGEPFELQIRRSDGQLLPCSCLARPLLDRFRDPAGYMLIFRDQRELQRLAEAASTDHLTGVWNRQRTTVMINEELERFQRYGQAFCLLMLDLDHFKQVNDNHGHLVGDQILIECARRIQRAIRSTDLLGRWGGEEFLVICPQSGREEGLQAAERIRRSVEAEAFSAGLRLTVSIGMALVLPGDSLARLLGRADDAMYCSKHLGRNQVSEACADR